MSIDVWTRVRDNSLDTDGVGLGVGPEGDLGENLVRERARHDPPAQCTSSVQCSEKVERVERTRGDR